MVCLSKSSSNLKLLGDVMLLVHWCGLATLAWVFGWIGCWSFDLLSGFMEGYVILKLHFEDFPFRANSVVHRMITIAICTFCFIFAESFVMALLLAIEAPWGDLIYTLLCFEWESQPLFPWEFPGHFLSKYMNLAVSNVHLSASSFFPLL